jgi:hypothetical protein
LKQTEIFINSSKFFFNRFSKTQKIVISRANNDIKIEMEKIKKETIKVEKNKKS